MIRTGGKIKTRRHLQPYVGFDRIRLLVVAPSCMEVNKIYYKGSGTVAFFFLLAVHLIVLVVAVLLALPPSSFSLSTLSCVCCFAIPLLYVHFVELDRVD